MAKGEINSSEWTQWKIEGNSTRKFEDPLYGDPFEGPIPEILGITRTPQVKFKQIRQDLLNSERPKFAQLAPLAGFTDLPFRGVA